MAIGDTIKKYRISKGLSQKELSARLGVTNTTVSYWESGRKSPGLDRLQEIAALLEIPVTLLLDCGGTGLQAKDEKFVRWFRSLPSEKQRAILIALDGPRDVAD